MARHAPARGQPMHVPVPEAVSLSALAARTGQAFNVSAVPSTLYVAEAIWYRTSCSRALRRPAGSTST